MQSVLCIFMTHKAVYIQKSNKRNMTTNKRNQNRTGELGTHKFFFIKQLSQWRSLSKNKLVWRAKITLGSSKLNCSRQYVILSKLLVLNSFIKNLFILSPTHAARSLVRYKNRLPGHQRRYTKRLTVSVGNESVPKTVINNTINYFLNCNQHFANFNFRGCLIKLLLSIYFVWEMTFIF